MFPHTSFHSFNWSMVWSMMILNADNPLNKSNRQSLTFILNLNWSRIIMTHLYSRYYRPTTSWQVEKKSSMRMIRWSHNRRLLHLIANTRFRKIELFIDFIAPASKQNNANIRLFQLPRHKNDIRSIVCLTSCLPRQEVCLRKSLNWRKSGFLSFSERHFSKTSQC